MISVQFIMVADAIGVPAIVPTPGAHASPTFSYLWLHCFGLLATKRALLPSRSRLEELREEQLWKQPSQLWKKGLIVVYIPQLSCLLSGVTESSALHPLQFQSSH